MRATNGRFVSGMYQYDHQLLSKLEASARGAGRIQVKVVPIAHGLEDIIGVSTGYRSPGLHASEIYNDLYQDLEPKRYKRGTTPNPLYLEMGLMLEHILEEALVRRLSNLERPSEFMTKEGIAYSPDGLEFCPDGSIVLLEYKCTTMSSKDMPHEPGNGFPPKFDKYMTQMKFYARNLGTTKARLYVFFVVGNYAPPVPELLVWDLEFTQQELEECHRMMINHARSKPYLRERLK